MRNKSIKKCIALMCAVSVAFSGSTIKNTIKAEEVETEMSEKDIAKNNYGVLVDKYESLVGTYKKETATLADAELTEGYAALTTKMDLLGTSLSEQRETMDYSAIQKAYEYCDKVLLPECMYFIDSVNVQSKKYQSGSAEYNSVNSLAVKTGTLKSNLDTQVKNGVGLFLEKYVNNQQFSDKLSVILNLDGGMYADSSKVTLEGYTNTKVALLTPQKFGYIFKGWEVVTGDCTITTSGSYYELNFNTLDGSIKPIWEYDGVTQFTPEPTKEPIVATEPVATEIVESKDISVHVSLEGGSLYGENTMTTKVKESSTIVLFENVYLLKKKGFYVDSFSCEYGSCKILDDGKVMYTAPTQAQSTIDSIKVVWKDTNAITDKSFNIVYIDLNSGVYIPSGKSELAFKKSIGTSEVILKTEELKKEGYVVSGVECNSFNAICTVQDGNIILKSTGFEKDGINITVVWSKEPISTPVITETPTQTPIITEKPVVSSVPTAQATVVPTINPTAAIPTVVPTTVPTATTKVEPTKEPVNSGAPAVSETPKQDTIDFKVNFYSTTIGVNESIKLTSSAKVNGTAEVISYKSADESIATVTDKGVIKGVATGSTQIIIKFGKYSRTVNIIVKLKPARVSFKKSMPKKVIYVLKRGKTKKLRVWFDKGSYSNKITLKTSNKKIATVTSNGIVKAKKKGTCKISVKTYNGKVGYAIIKVK